MTFWPIVHVHDYRARARSGACFRALRPGISVGAGVKMRISRVCLTLAVAAGAAVVSALTAGPALGQVDTGAIRGTVTDSSGAVVANVKVTLKNEDTGLVVS